MEQIATTTFPRLARRGVLLGLSLAQLAVAGAGIVLAAGALIRGGAAALAFTAPLWAGLVAVAVVRVKGRSLVEWTPTVLAFVGRRAGTQTTYHPRPARPVPAGTMRLPGRAAAMRVLAAGDGWGMVHQPHHRRVVAVIPVSAPAFLLLDSSDQTRRVDGWARVLAGLCQSGRIARAQVLERTVPDGGDVQARWWVTHGRHDDSWPSRLYDDLVAGGSAGVRHETYLSLALDLDRARRQVRQAGGGKRGAAIVLDRECRTVETALAGAGLDVGSRLDPRQIAAVIRGAYDPTAAQLIDRRAQDPDSTPGIAPEAAGPILVEEHAAVLHTGSAWHATWWVMEWPHSPVPASFLLPLVTLGGVQRTLSLHYQPVEVTRALRDVRRDRVEHAVDAHQRARLGQLETAAQAAEREDVARREQQLTAGHGDMLWTALVTLSATNRDQLDEATAGLHQAATHAMVDLRPLTCQQGEAFTAGALPLALGLR